MDVPAWTVLASRTRELQGSVTVGVVGGERLGKASRGCGCELLFGDGAVEGRSGWLARCLGWQVVVVVSIFHEVDDELFGVESRAVSYCPG